MRYYEIITNTTVDNTLQSYLIDNFKQALMCFNNLSYVFRHTNTLGYVRLIDNTTGEILKELVLSMNIQKYTSATIQ